MSTFAQLKGYPFFREPHNWFYPFDRMHSSIIHQVGLNQSGESSVLSIILQSGFFCNSDKYSFCFTIAQLPQGQRDMMLSQMTPQDQSDFMEEKNNASLKQFADGLMLSVTSTFTIYTVSSNLANADLSFIISSRKRLHCTAIRY